LKFFYQTRQGHRRCFTAEKFVSICQWSDMLYTTGPSQWCQQSSTVGLL